MTQIIIYQADDETTSVVFPTDDLPVEEVAKKDVPAGKPYLIVDRSSLPDGQFQSAWAVDFSKPDGHGLGHEGWLKQYVDGAIVQDTAHAENAEFDMMQELRNTP